MTTPKGIDILWEVFRSWLLDHRISGKSEKRNCKVPVFDKLYWNCCKQYLLYLRATIQGVKLVWILLSFYSISSFLTNTIRKHFKWKLAFTSHAVGHSKLGKVSQREDYWPLSVNPLTPKISLVILLAVCHTILVMLVGRIWD